MKHLVSSFSLLLDSQRSTQGWKQHEEYFRPHHVPTVRECTDSPETCSFITMSAQLKNLVKLWLSMDPNPITRAEIQNLWEECRYEELEKRMSRRIGFGTAGLRGKMEAGWNRMNDLIIIQTSQGLAQYVLKTVDNARERGLVVGYDHRHHSEHWAHLTAGVFISSGFKIQFLRGFNPTPMVPFAMQVFHAACGVMVTASHNPKDDNGFKVYWENAIQITGPYDTEISKAIEANLEPQSLFTDIYGSHLFNDVTDILQKKYFEYLKTICFSRNVSKPIKFVNTSMHGVSDRFVAQAFQVLEFPPYTPVLEQQYPDPEFPSVKFPNPEEKGALNCALATAEKIGAQYILAQDPDADRFSAGEKSPTGEWAVFTGDQLGVIFANKVLQDYKSSGQPIDRLAMVASTVSSKMLARMAEIEGFKFSECFTGFKFIGNTALQLMKQGYNVLFSYEEAIGFMFGQHILDKDGVAATIKFVELVYSLQAQKKTVQQYLDGIYERYGHFKTRNGYFLCSDSEIIEKVFIRLRNVLKPKSYPTKLGNLSIVRTVDLTNGYDSGNPPSFIPSLPICSGQMIQFHAKCLEFDICLYLTLRTSGTEPKIKFYLEANGLDLTQIETELDVAISDISENWIKASEYHLSMVL